MQEQICPVHGTENKWVPAGVSGRTGQPYAGFFTCNTCNPPKPRRQAQPVGQPQYAPTTQRPVQQAAASPNWDEISRGKVRYGFALKSYEMGEPLDFATTNKILKWTEFSMTGVLPGVPPTDQANEPEEVIPF